jgi:hypothetical protein
VHDPVRFEQCVDIAGDAGGVVRQGHRGAAHYEYVCHDVPAEEAIAQRLKARSSSARPRRTLPGSLMRLPGPWRTSRRHAS